MIHNEFFYKNIDDAETHKILKSIKNDWDKHILIKFFDWINDKCLTGDARFCKIAQVEQGNDYVAFFLTNSIQLNAIRTRYEICGYLSYTSNIRKPKIYYADLTHYNDTNMLWIQDNYITSPNMKNKGIGSAGMSCIKNLAVQLNCEKIQGKAQVTNVINKNEMDKLISFYSKNGFTINPANDIITFLL